MKNDIDKFIEDIVLETSLDSRIDEGIFDIYNPAHLDIMGEHMEARGLEESAIREIIEKVIQTEGKYTERQAYNRDGWLVTFPSPEYRDAAVKKGTHSISDPTHGKGGMNLYYKRKGKQKRQVAQPATQVKPAPAQQQVTKNAQTVKPAQPTVSRPKTLSGQTVDKSYTKNEVPKKVSPKDEPDEDYGAATAGEDDEMDKYLASKLGNLYKSKYTQPAAVATQPASQVSSAEEKPAIVQQVSQASQPNVKSTETFASQKGWKSTAYGEWRDEAGNTVAISSPSGEVTPIKNTDREELKLFLSKQSS
jgi:hypothetical protein